MSWQGKVAKQRRSLFISAGHSETDPGAHGNGLHEADVVLELRDALCHELGQRGLVFTRDGERGENMPLRDAWRMASAHDVAVELHLNAATPAATGVETLSASEHYPLGNRLCSAVSDTLGIDNRGAKREDSGQHSRLAFVSDGGGLILELFFVTNANDVQAYHDDQRAVVQALASVLIEEVTT